MLCGAGAGGAAGWDGDSGDNGDNGDSGDRDRARVGFLPHAGTPLAAPGDPEGLGQAPAARRGRARAPQRCPQAPDALLFLKDTEGTAGAWP